jgi:Domain of unknown function (DUF4440)
MKISALLIAVLATSSLTSVAYCQSSNKDEQTILSYMQQIPEHAGKADAASKAFWEKLNGAHSTNIEPNGQLEDYTATDTGSMLDQLAKESPEMKVSASFKDTKVRVYGDTAIVTYLQDLTVSGMKDDRLNGTTKSRCLDTWQRQSGQWKVIATTNTPVEPLGSDKYKMTPSGMGGPH